MKKKFFATSGMDGVRLISVRAETEAEARNEIKDQLERPGRYPIFLQWVRLGKWVTEVNGD